MNPSSPAAGEALAIETVELTRRFGNYVAVDRLTCASAAAPCSVCSAQTARARARIIKMLTTLLPPTSGQATVAGFDVVREPRAVRSAHRLRAAAALRRRRTHRAGEPALSAALYGIHARRARAAASPDALAFMGLDEAADKLVKTYSGGMIRRLESRRPCCTSPRCCSWTSPRSASIRRPRRSVWDRLLELRDRSGTTIF